MKIEATARSRRMLQDQINKAKSSDAFARKHETLVIPDLCDQIGLVSGYDDVKAHIFSCVLKRPSKGGIVVCSDASVIHSINGVAGIGFIAYSEKTHELVGYGHAMLTHALGRGFSSIGAETLGMAIAAYAMRGFSGVITCDNESSVNNFNRACRHTRMAEIARWGKGHADSLGNLTADRYAKAALADIKDLAPSLGRPGLIDGGRATVTPNLWQERVNLPKNHSTVVFGASRYVRSKPGMPTTLRTALVQTPCLENPLQHSFMIVGMRGSQVVSVESGSLSSDAERQGWADHIPMLFMKHLQMRYTHHRRAAIRHMTVSPYIRRYHDAGLRDMDRAISAGQFDMGENGYEKSNNPTIRLAGMMETMRDQGIRFSIEKNVRGCSIEHWEDCVRAGVAPEAELETFLNRHPPRPRWKPFDNEPAQVMAVEPEPFVDLANAPQPDMPIDFPLSSKTAFKMGY